MTSQRGSIFLYILIAVALFAALSYAISRGTSGRGISTERADILATELIQQGNMFKEAVARVRLNGFTKFQVSFENSIQAGYTNGNCTSTRCRVFSPDGGGLEWMNPPTGANTQKTWAFGGLSINDVGFNNGDPRCSLSNPCTELVALVPFISDEVCTRINVKASTSTGIITQSSANFINKFSGSLSASGFRFGNDNVLNGTVSGRTFFCVRSPSASGPTITQGGPAIATPLNVFYYVLIAN